MEVDGNGRKEETTNRVISASSSSPSLPLPPSSPTPSPLQPRHREPKERATPLPAAPVGTPIILAKQPSTELPREHIRPREVGGARVRVSERES